MMIIAFMTHALSWMTILDWIPGRRLYRNESGKKGKREYEGPRDEPQTDRRAAAFPIRLIVRT
jgi:hypothetical protein